MFLIIKIRFMLRLYSFFFFLTPALFISYDPLPPCQSVRFTIFPILQQLYHNIYNNEYRRTNETNNLDTCIFLITKIRFMLRLYSFFLFHIYAFRTVRSSLSLPICSIYYTRFLYYNNYIII